MEYDLRRTKAGVCGTWLTPGNSWSPFVISLSFLAELIPSASLAGSNSRAGNPSLYPWWCSCMEGAQGMLWIRAGIASCAALSLQGEMSPPQVELSSSGVVPRLLLSDSRVRVRLSWPSPTLQILSARCLFASLNPSS